MGDAAPIVAPVVEAAPAPAPVDASQAPADVAAPSGTAQASEPQAFPSPEGFAWDGWDGTPDALPEPVRPWVEPLSKHFLREVEALKGDFEFSKRSYDALLAGHPDPRLEKLQGELQAKVEELQKFIGTKAELEKKLVEAEKKAAQLQDSWAAYEQKQGEAVAEAFASKNKWIFENESLATLASTLIDEGFALDKEGRFVGSDLEVLLRMPEPLLERARAIHKELTGAGARGIGAHAIRMAKAEFKLAPPNGAAALVSPTERVSAARTDRGRVEGEPFQSALERSIANRLPRK